MMSLLITSFSLLLTIFSCYAQDCQEHVLDFNCEINKDCQIEGLFETLNLCRKEFKIQGGARFATVGGKMMTVVSFTYWSNPTAVVTDLPTEYPTRDPTELPTTVPTELPTTVPTELPTTVPTELPTSVPTELPTTVPTELPTTVPTELPTTVPTEHPTEYPTRDPTRSPTRDPTEHPTEYPTRDPTESPTRDPTELPTTVPTELPTTLPTELLTTVPTELPTTVPTELPTTVPTEHPTISPTRNPTRKVYKLLGDKDDRTAFDEGNTVLYKGKEGFFVSNFEACEDACTETEGCHSFAYCHNGSCWLKDKADFTGSERTKFNNCATYYEA